MRRRSRDGYIRFVQSTCEEESMKTKLAFPEPADYSTVLERLKRLLSKARSETAEMNRSLGG